MPVPDEVVSLLSEMQQAQPEGLPYVFLAAGRYAKLRRNGKPEGEILHGLGTGFKRIRNLAGIDEGTIHDMRRTCITNCAQHPDLKPKDVQIRSGHEDLNTTPEIYTMVEEEDVVEKALRILQDSTDKTSTRASTMSGS